MNAAILLTPQAEPCREGDFRSTRLPLWALSSGQAESCEDLGSTVEGMMTHEPGIREGAPSITREPLAHVDKDGRPHLLIDHLHAVAELAREFGRRVGAADHARLAGLWHDLGKYAGNFQKMIREENGFEAHIEGDTSGPRDHSTAGAIHAVQRLGPAGRIIAFAIAGHHAGLPNAQGGEGRSLVDRLELSERLDAALRGGAPREVLDQAPLEVPNHIRQDARLLELWTRLVFSALCDADCLDTESFFDVNRAALRGSAISIAELRRRLDKHLDAIETSAPPTEVNRLRAEVRRACADAAVLTPGAFSLTVPTGGGKTLAAMAFALAHAEQHGMDRVIVAIPFTSIIEQSARAYRSAFGEDGAVLEHHSAIDPYRETPRSRVASENWDAPVIVTTNVQLFESLLANRPAASAPRPSPHSRRALD